MDSGKTAMFSLQKQYFLEHLCPGLQEIRRIPTLISVTKSPLALRFIFIIIACDKEYR